MCLVSCATISILNRFHQEKACERLEATMSSRAQPAKVPDEVHSFESDSYTDEDYQLEE